MITVRVPSEPGPEPVTLDEAKQHCRVDYDDEDTLIEAYISAAREYAEVVTRRTLALATWEARLGSFPEGAIELPHPPLLEVESVRYTAPDGAEVALEPEAYRVDTAIEPGVITPVGGWPRGTDVRIRYRAGYEDAIPHQARLAILMLVGHWYEHREAVVTGTITAEVPMAVDRLLWAIRLYEVA